MVRSEKAERTYQQIIEASAKLFVEKGYEKTSIQDILDEVKMSRGVVYYYFKSKKDILDAIQAQRLDGMRSMVKSIQAENAREKIAKALSMIIEVEDMPDVNVTNDQALEHLKDPHIILSNMQACASDAKLLVSLFEEGVKDASIDTEYPLQMAELMFLLISTWLNPVVFNRDLEQTKTYLKFIQQTLSKLGADILDEELMDSLINNWKQFGYFN